MRALLIGINYYGTSAELRGCINDVKNMRKYLLTRGYRKSDIHILTEKSPEKPTHDNIVKYILELLKGDGQLFLHYSGHGSWLKDVNGDEKDGRDEALVPLDYSSAGLITDDQLRGLLSFIRPDAKLSVVLDCCHSGTGLDLAFTLHEYTNVQRKLENKQMRWVREKKFTMRKDRRYSATPGEVVMISGCLDKQYSYDAYQSGEFQGAMTCCLLENLKDNPGQSLEDLVKNVRELLTKKGYPQTPYLTSGRKISLQEKFTL